MSGAAGDSMTAVLDGLAADSAGAVIRFVQLVWSDKATAVRGRRLDASFVPPPLTDLADLELIRLGDEPRSSCWRLPTRSPTAPMCRSTSWTARSRSPRTWWTSAGSRFWSCGPRLSGVPSRYGPVISTTDEMLMAVAQGTAIAITAAAIASHRHRPGVVFVPVRDIDPSRIALCTQQEDRSPPIAALRQVVRTIAMSTGDGPDAGPPSWVG